jgi:hypothetical protein
VRYQRQDTQLLLLLPAPARVRSGDGYVPLGPEDDMIKDGIVHCDECGKSYYEHP